jgi:hypothetical protein
MDKNAKYKFNTNLLKASYSQELENAIKEWNIICDEKRNINDGICICQRKVKNVIYLYNIKTKNTIIVGSACYKKFNMKNEKLSNKILSEILRNSIIKGEYTNIDNIITYCSEVQEQLLTYINTEYTNNISNIEKLKELSIVIKDLIHQYNLDYLVDINLLITNKLDELVKEKQQLELEYKMRIDEENKQKEIRKLKYLEYKNRIDDENKQREIKKLEYLESKKKIDESKIYCVRKYIRFYISGFKYETTIDANFVTMDECINYLSNMKPSNEFSVLKIEILLHGKIIRKMETFEEMKQLIKF